MLPIELSRLPLLTRRAVLTASAAMLAMPRARAGELPTLKIGTLPFGTVQWEVQTITGNAFDRAAGIELQNVPLASNDAARTAFLSGSVDVIVNDLLFAARLKAEGKPVRFLPYSTTEGALMVSAASPIKSLADLKGKAIGVAGGPLDKSWLVMRAAATKTAGLDLTADAHPVFGAPPLLAAKLESGELDCGLLYWSDSARLAAKGYRRVESVEAMADTLGAKGKIAFVGFLFMESVPAKGLEGFGKAVRRAEALLADKPESWAAIRPLMRAKEDATFEALKSVFLGGIPHKPRAEEIADAQAFFATLAKLGGPPLVGNATSLPEGLYVDQAVYG